MTLFVILIITALILFSVDIYCIIKAFRQKRRAFFLLAGLSLVLSVAFALGAVVTVVKKGYSKAEKIISRKMNADSTERTTGYGLLAEYDFDKPDTKANKERFEDYLKTPINSNVKDVYCYADFMGADHTIQMTFTCDTATLSKIIYASQLSKGDEDIQGRNLAREFDWWNEKAIDSIRPFKSVQAYELHKYLWFDSASGKAYYLEFSL